MTIVRNDINIKTIEAKIYYRLFSLDEGVRKIITSVFASYNSKICLNPLLIMGNTEDAKIILQTIAKELKVPYVQVKYYNIADIAIALIEQSENDIEIAERGIVVIEDVEESVNSPQEMRNLISFLGLSGIIIPKENGNEEEKNKEIVLYTDNLTIVFLSKFDMVKEIRDIRLKPNIGFGPKHKENRYKRILKEDILKYNPLYKGLVELIDDIIELDYPNIEQLTKRLENIHISLFRMYQIELYKMGIKLLFDKKIFQSIASMSLSIDKEGKETDRIIHFIFEDIMYHVLANPGKFKKCEISLGIVSDNTQYKLSWEPKKKLDILWIYIINI